jgi:(p)ppGpp synthase/HD superfamily hydrolase
MINFDDPAVKELQFRTNNIPHSASNLFDHLCAVYTILKNSNKPDYVCIAGLFHSVYETEYFKFSRPYTRDEVKRMIGEKAEELVYEFCNTVPRVTKLTERSGNWSDQMYADLLDIELANMYEQRYYNTPIQMMEAIRKHLVIKD